MSGLSGNDATVDQWRMLTNKLLYGMRDDKLRNLTDGNVRQTAEALLRSLFNMTRVNFDPSSFEDLQNILLEAIKLSRDLRTQKDIYTIVWPMEATYDSNIILNKQGIEPRMRQ